MKIPFDAFILNKVFVFLERAHLINFTVSSSKKSTITACSLDLQEDALFQFDTDVSEDKDKSVKMKVKCANCKKTVKDRFGWIKYKLHCSECALEFQNEGRTVKLVDIKDNLTESRKATYTAINSSEISYRQAGGLFDIALNDKSVRRRDPDWKKQIDTFIEFPIKESLSKPISAVYEDKTKEDNTHSVNIFTNFLQFFRKNTLHTEKEHSQPKRRRMSTKDTLAAVQAVALSNRFNFLNKKRAQISKEQGEFTVLSSKISN